MSNSEENMTCLPGTPMRTSGRWLGKTSCASRFTSSESTPKMPRRDWFRVELVSELGVEPALLLSRVGLLAGVEHVTGTGLIRAALEVFLKAEKLCKKECCQCISESHAHTNVQRLFHKKLVFWHVALFVS